VHRQGTKLGRNLCVQNARETRSHGLWSPHPLTLLPAAIVACWFGLALVVVSARLWCPRPDGPGFCGMTPRGAREKPMPESGCRRFPDQAPASLASIRNCLAGELAEELGRRSARCSDTIEPLPAPTSPAECDSRSLSCSRLRPWAPRRPHMQGLRGSLRTPRPPRHSKAAALLRGEAVRFGG